MEKKLNALFCVAAVFALICSTALSGCMEKSDNNAPVAAFSSGDTVLVSTEVKFNASDSYDMDNDTLMYSWDFGDSLGAGSVIVGAVQPEAVHTYYKAGSYRVVLSVNDGKSASQASKTVRVVYGTNKKPIAVIGPDIYNPASVGVNDRAKDEAWSNITFDGSDSYDEDGTIISYDWDFNSTYSFVREATGRSATHGFPSGAHMVTLRVVDDFNDYGRETAWAVVNYSVSHFGLLTANVTSNPNTQDPQLPPPFDQIPLPQNPNNPQPAPPTPNANPATFDAMFNVHDYAATLIVNLSFRPSNEYSQIQGTNINNVNLYLYDEWGLVDQSETSLNANTTENQTKSITLTADSGRLNGTSTGYWLVHLAASSGINVEYTLTVEVKYAVPTGPAYNPGSYTW